MRKNALKICCFACAFGAVGAFCRWLQNQIAFDEAGLSTHSVLNTAMVLVLLAAAVVFYFLATGSKKTGLIPADSFNTAFAGTTKMYMPLAWVIGAVMIFGALVLFMTGAEEKAPVLVRILAALALFSGVFFPLAAAGVKRDGVSGTVCLYVTLPVLQLCMWLITCYKDNATNPTVWVYAVEILAIAASLIAFYYLAGYAYGRIKTYNCLYFCMLGAFLCIVSLADDINFGEKLMFVSAAAMQLFGAWMIVSNMRIPQEKQTPDEPKMEPITEKDIGAIINEVSNDSEK